MRKTPRWIVAVEPEPAHPGTRLRELRERCDREGSKRRRDGQCSNPWMRQQDVAERLMPAISPTTLSQYESGQNPIPPDVLEQLVVIYEAEHELDDLFRQQSAHDLWQRRHKRLPGKGVAIEGGAAIQRLLGALDLWDDAQVDDLAKRLAAQPAPTAQDPARRKDPHRELTEEDWDGDERVAG